MLTIFSTPKSFEGHIGVIQRNAIQSWLSLQPKPEVILLGNDRGTAEAASEFAIRHEPAVDCNEYGTPLLNSIFSIAQDMAGQQLMCYVNADIILMSDFLLAICQIQRQSFLLVGQRWDIDLKVPVDFSNPLWETRLRASVKERGKLHGLSGLDYFVFHRGLYRDMPPFAIGRTVWDNWLIYRARFLGTPVIDATEAIIVVHQNHDYSHHPAGESGVWKGLEAQQNRELAGEGKYAFSLYHATHILTPRGIRRALTPRHLYFRLETVPVLYPRLHFLYRPLKALTNLIVHIRSMLGMTRN